MDLPLQYIIIMKGKIIYSTKPLGHKNNNNNGHLYCASIRQFWRSWRMNIIIPVIGPVISFLEPSLPPCGVCSPCCQMSNTITISAITGPHLYSWRKAIIVKCLAQGHKHPGCGRDLNPHSDYSAIRTQIRCTKPLSHKNNNNNNIKSKLRSLHNNDQKRITIFFKWHNTCLEKKYNTYIKLTQV